VLVLLREGLAALLKVALATLTLHTFDVPIYTIGILISLRALCVLSVCSLFVLCVLSVCSLFVLCVLSVCSLFVLCVLSV